MIGLYTSHHLTNSKPAREGVVNALEMSNVLIHFKLSGIIFFFYFEERIFGDLND